MPQIKRYDSNAARQKAYRARRKLANRKKPVDTALLYVTCTAYVPKGTRCKLCGKAH